jgi:hypothetical protein
MMGGLCATAEQWLAHPTPTNPKKLLPCLTAGSRPKLDGKLNDPVWQRKSLQALARTT